MRHVHECLPIMIQTFMKINISRAASLDREKIFTWRSKRGNPCEEGET